MYAKLTIKTPERRLLLLLLTLDIFRSLFYCYYYWIWFEKIRFQTLNLFWVTVRNILSYGLGQFVGLHIFIFIHRKQGCERIIFTTALQKHKSNSASNSLETVWCICSFYESKKLLKRCIQNSMYDFSSTLKTRWCYIFLIETNGF